MTNSWEWVEKQNRRERWQKRWRIFGIAIALLYALFTFVLPRFPGPADDDQSNETNLAETLVEPSKSPIDSPPPRYPSKMGVSSTASDADKTVAESSSPTVPSDAVVVDEAAEAATASAPVRETSVAPEPPKFTPEQLRAADNSANELNRKIESLDGSSNRLEKYGGSSWNQIQRLIQATDSIESPILAKARNERAIAQLDLLEADLDYGEFREQIRGKGHGEIFSAIVAFSALHANNPNVNELEASLKRLSANKWLAMAEDELKGASPDEAGFAESWLPIATAWQLVGNEAEARESLRQAIEALPRMTQPERAVESTFEICQHESLDRTRSRELIADASSMCQQFANRTLRSNYLANLSGLAKKLGCDTESNALLQLAISPSNIPEEFGETERKILNQKARAASWTESPEDVFAICAKIEKLNYPKPLINANAYGHAAIAAARRNDQAQFFKAMLLTENALAPRRIYDFPDYLYTARLVEANILQRRWRAAIVVANNVPDPYLRASYLFRVMRHAPQEVRFENLPDLFERYAEQRWASLACASFAEHRVRTGESLLSTAEWLTSLPSASLRAAAFAGIARSAGTNTVSAEPDNALPITKTIRLDDVASLLDEAEESANRIQQSLEAAFAWLAIARTSQLMDKTARYDKAVGKINDNLFDAWYQVWSQRPPVKKSYNGGYIDTSDRHRKQEERMIAGIIDCYRHLAEMQTDFGDSRGAMDALLNWANTASFQCLTATFSDENFLRMKALLNRLQGATGVGPDAIPLANHHFYRYSRAMVAAWSKDIPSLEQLIPELTARSQKRGNSSSDRMYPARAFAELAILHAERGNIESYRNARRSAQSLISQRSAGSELQLALATSDALAGEFALAESNLVRGSLLWFGDASRPRSQLAVSLSADGQWEKATGHAAKVSPTQFHHRAKAWTAVAKARRKKSSESEQIILDWTKSLDSQVDRTAVFCGLALAAASR